FPDQIALCGAPIEDLASLETRWRHVADYGAYGIPWRSLVPEGVGAVCVAGRCLSATHAAHASARSMGTCMAMGQAAGTAAAMAAARSIDVSEVDPAKLRSELAAAGATVEADWQGGAGATGAAEPAGSSGTPGPAEATGPARWTGAEEATGR